MLLVFYMLDDDTGGLLRDKHQELLFSACSSQRFLKLAAFSGPTTAERKPSDSTRDMDEFEGCCIAFGLQKSWRNPEGISIRQPSSCVHPRSCRATSCTCLHGVLSTKGSVEFFIHAKVSFHSLVHRALIPLTISPRRDLVSRPRHHSVIIRVLLRREH